LVGKGIASPADLEVETRVGSRLVVHLKTGANQMGEGPAIRGGRGAQGAAYSVVGQITIWDVFGTQGTVAL
jgi:hypothetical protein